jgi:membrane-associated protease RseP (regulator of RpoE activity)
MPAMLLAATVLTTTANGARFMQNFREGIPPVVRDSDLWPWSWLFAHSQLFVTGLAFSLSLLGILLVHEFGHFFACRAHAIRATLPWVLPAPTLSGTVGAVIRILSPIPDRNALMDVGVYGPLAGYAASVIAIIAGFGLTIRFVHGLLLRWYPSLPDFDHCAPHPVLIAGWIGLFITSLNLIPGGQLDGGHILYSISPRIHRIVTNTLPLLLLSGGIFLWAGWLLWGAFLLIPALRHPRVSLERKLTRGRIVLGILGLAIFLLTFTPTPLHDNSLLQLLR